MNRGPVHECTSCPHLATSHRLVAGGDLVAGPYRCRYCGCEIRQDAPTRRITIAAMRRDHESEVADNA